MSIEMMSNLESLGEMIGALEGMSEGLDRPEYIAGLIKQAHGKATSAFDLAAAATGGAGHLDHVFEYGTAGITPGPVKFPDPTSPAARLYVHQLSGHGGNQDIWYTFRPARQRNPQPTVASTGVASKYLAKLSRRKYIFWNRALVMETGQTVSVRAKNSDFLFVPFGGEVANNPLNRRGFVMWNTKKLGPITSTPGRDTKGQFTAFWMNWWGSAGSNLMNADMMKSVTIDTEKAVAAAAARANRESMKPAQATNVLGAAASGKSWVKKWFMSKRRGEVEAK